MKLFTKDIDKKLFAQYQEGSDLDKQVAVAKIFNPYGNGRWFLLNSDPQDPDYLWAIVQMGDVVEVGSVLRSELESVRVSPFKFPLERDLGFSMVNAGELYRGLLQGKFYKKGGMVDGYARGGMVAGRWYKDNTGNELRYIGETEGKLLFNDGEKLVTKTEEDFEEEVKEKKLFGFFEEGGFVDKTDEELKGMTDDELFDYLDAKAAYMKQYARPLSSFKAKNFAANSAAVQFKNEGTAKLDANFPSLSKINEQATKDYQETIAKRADKMAEGGSTQNGWYEKFNAGFEDLLKKGYINDAEYKYLEKWLENYDPLDDYGNMGGRAAAKKYVDDNRRYVEMAKGGMTEHGLKVGDKIVADQFWDKNIVVENTKTKKKAIVDLESGKRKESMAMGGKVKFQDKVKAIKASLLKTKKVPKKVQKDYGKTYNAKEAELAAKRIAGAMAKKGMK